MNDDRYTRTAIALHWLMAVLILVALPLGMFMHELELSPLKLKLYAWHKWLGVTVFGLALLRIVWRLLNRPPALPDMPVWQKRLAAVAHGLIYLLMFLVPLSGWLMSSAKGFQTVYLGLWPIPDLLGKDVEWGERLEAVHEALSNGFLLLLLLHVLAALKHHHVEGDDVMRRMLPFSRRRRFK